MPHDPPSPRATRDAHAAGTNGQRDPDTAESDLLRIVVTRLGDIEVSVGVLDAHIKDAVGQIARLNTVVRDGNGTPSLTHRMVRLEEHREQVDATLRELITLSRGQAAQLATLTPLTGAVSELTERLDGQDRERRGFDHNWRLLVVSSAIGLVSAVLGVLSQFLVK